MILLRNDDGAVVIEVEEVEHELFAVRSWDADHNEPNGSEVTLTLFQIRWLQQAGIPAAVAGHMPTPAERQATRRVHHHR